MALLLALRLGGLAGDGHPRRRSWRGRRVLAWPALPSRGPKRGEGPRGSVGSSPVARMQRRQLARGPCAAQAPQVLGLLGHDLKGLFKRRPSPTALSCHLCQKSDDCRFLGLFLDRPVPRICLPDFMPTLD